MYFSVCSINQGQGTQAVWWGLCSAVVKQQSWITFYSPALTRFQFYTMNYLFLSYTSVIIPAVFSYYHCLLILNYSSPTSLYPSIPNTFVRTYLCATRGRDFLTVHTPVGHRMKMEILDGEEQWYILTTWPGTRVKVREEGIQLIGTEQGIPSELPLKLCSWKEKIIQIAAYAILHTKFL